MRTGLIAAAVAALSFGTVAQAQNYLLEPRIGFPDFKAMPPPSEHQGPVFVLADAYPLDAPAIDEDVQRILSIDFTENPTEYAMAVRDYVFAGNIVGNGDVSRDFVLQRNAIGRPWYHVPWQHWGANGREGYHGLTREGPLATKSLAPEQTEPSSAYAVGFYNAQGGFALGQVWPSADQGPNLQYFLDGNGFPEGTVVGKFLFTVLDDSQVPYLTNPLTWDAYVYDCDVPSATRQKCPSPMTGEEPRSTQTMHLLQMDIMVKDSRATEAAGWVFGTFVYNGELEAGNRYAAACADFEGMSRNWCNLMPVGVMWGNDPENNTVFYNPTPTETVINANLEETWINPDEAMPAMHLGFNSRLNGPADNPHSSCMSCHSTAQYPTVSAIMPFLNDPPVPIPAIGTQADDAWMRWFRNFRDGEAFDEFEAIPLDFSLQLTGSVENYIEWRSQSQQGLFALEYWGEGDAHDVSRNVVME
jgi:hypothetical protein